MRLYATITSERDSRPAKKGGNDYIRISLTDGNQEIALIIVQCGSLVIYHRPEIVRTQVNNIMPSDIPW